VGEAEQDELKERALWSYRANPPMEGDERNRRVVPFDRWWRQISGEPVEVVMPDMDKIERLMGKAKRGEMRRVN